MPVTVRLETFRKLDSASALSDFSCVKTISVDVPDSMYQDIAQRAKQTGQSAEDLLRVAMELVRKNSSPSGRTSLLSLKPLDLGKPLRPLNGGDDLLGEMLNGNGH